MLNRFWQQDQAEKEKILEVLWNKLRNGEFKEESQLYPLKEFIKDCMHNDSNMNLKIDILFEKTCKKEISLDTFKKTLDGLTPLDAKLLDLNNQLGVHEWNEPENLSLNIDDKDLVALKEYLRIGQFSAAISIGNVNGIYKNITSIADATPSSSFAIHSVAKIFTGVLMLRMIEEGIILRKHLDEPIKDHLEDSAWKLLSDKVEVQPYLEKEKITLLHLMTHRGGVGDYGYDSETGGYREALKKDKILMPDMTDIKNFLQFAEDKIYKVPHYSNLGITLVGLAIEHGYNQFRIAHPEKNLEQLNFFGILKKYVNDPAKIENFSATRPENGIFNKADKVAGDWVGGPAGGYWTTTEDLVKFGQWLYQKCSDPQFKTLMTEFGEEFYRKEFDRIEHAGESRYYSSAFLGVSLKTGNVISVLSDQPGISLPLGLDLFTSEKIFKHVDLSHEKSVQDKRQFNTTMIVGNLGIEDTKISTPQEHDIADLSALAVTAEKGSNDTAEPNRPDNQPVETPTQNTPTPFSTKLTPK